MCAYRRSRDADRARITRVINVSEWPPPAQCSVYTVVLVLCRDKLINKGGQRNNDLNRNDHATSISSGKPLIFSHIPQTGGGGCQNV